MANPRNNPVYKNQEIKLSSSDHWRTPAWIFDKLHAEFKFVVDLAADHQNHLLPAWFTKEQSALEHDWTFNAFGNIPYSSPKDWFLKARLDSQKFGVTIVLLVRVDPANNYWIENVKDAHVRFLAGRVKFWDDNNKPHYSAKWSNALIIFSPETHGNPTTEYWDYRGEKAEKLF